MIDRIDGFILEVKERDGLPRVRVSIAESGTVVVNTDEVSIEGLRRLAAVFERASDMAYQEIDFYWARKHEALLHEKRADNE